MISLTAEVFYSKIKHSHLFLDLPQLFEE